MSFFSPLYELFERSVELQHVGLIRDVKLDMLRLDKIDSVISGNKIFKLYKYLVAAQKAADPKILTFGGPYSNHLMATAKVGQLLGIKTIGIVRGSLKETKTITIQNCKENGMSIIPMERTSFRKMAENPGESNDGSYTIVPMGGYSREGAEGASLILKYIDKNRYTHICTPVGTATTLAGLLTDEREETVLAYPAIKGMIDIPLRLNRLGIKNLERLKVVPQYHFGGFAKRNEELIGFMNDFYRNYSIPTDFVYTAKMMFGIMQQISNNYFPVGSRILAIHTGGIQGNCSLPKGKLIF